MTALLVDVRFALRQLARRPIFALSAIISLALGLGVNTSLFSVADAMLFQLPPAGNAGELVRVYLNHHSPFRYDDYRYFKERNTVFSHLIGEDSRLVSWSSGSETERAQATVVSGDYFQTMEIRPALGQFFSRARDDVPAATPVAVVSWRFWQARLGGDSSVIGRVVRLNDHAFQVVAIAPEGFTSALTLFAPDFFVPMGDTQALLGAGPRILGGGLYVSARLKPGVTRDQANAEAGLLMHQLAAADSVGHAHLTARVDHARGMNAEERAPLLAAAGALQLVALLVLLIACSNIGNLLLARNAARRRELGIRVAVGASRARLVRQLLTESTVLAAVATVLALWVAAWMGDIANGLLPAAAKAEIYIPVSMNIRIVGFALGLGVLTMMVAGLAPALQAASGDVSAKLRDDSGMGSARRSRARRNFLFAQVALCTVLLVCATLFGRSLQHANAIDPGYPSAGIVDVSIRLPSASVPAERRLAFWQTYLERLRTEPGVRRAAIVSTVPLAGSRVESSAWIEGIAADRRVDEHHVQLGSISPEYFSTLQIPLLAGRDFNDRDMAAAPLVAIVNETLARTAFGGNAIGRRISMDGPQGPWADVVGVAKDIRYNSLGESPLPFLYLPEWQAPDTRGVVQLAVAPGTPIAALRDAATKAARIIDPTLAPPDVAWLVDAQRIVLFPAQAAAGVLGGFGILALLLATVGIFGVAAFAVAQRTREIGVRTALGAPSSSILRSVLGETARTVLIAGGVGVVASLGLGQALRSQLYGVSAADPITFIGVPLLLTLAAVAATYVPARRALRVDPAVALRGE
jgi:predicted permease